MVLAGGAFLAERHWLALNCTHIPHTSSDHFFRKRLNDSMSTVFIFSSSTFNELFHRYSRVNRVLWGKQIRQAVY